MSKPDYQQFFEQFKGLDTTPSPLVQATDSAIEFKNLEKLFNGSLRGKQGCKLAAQPMHVKAIYPYTYTDSEGKVIKELVGVAVPHEGTGGLQTLMRLKTETSYITVSPAIPTLWTLSIRFEDEGVLFEITDNVSGAVYFSKNLGTGYEAVPYTLLDLKTELELLTDFIITIPNTAVINQVFGHTITAPSTTLNVDAGHTLAKGDWVSYFNNYTNFFIPPGGETWSEVIATTATTVEITGYDFSPGSNAVPDNAVIGHGRFPAAILDLKSTSATVITVPSTVYPPVAFTYSYWEIIPCAQFTNSDVYSSMFTGASNNKDYALPSFANRRNCLYLTSGYAKSYNYTKDLSQEGVAGFSDLLAVKSSAGLWKYDGKSVYLSGFPFDDALGKPFTVATTGANPIVAGDYQYQISFLFKDAQDNEFEWFDPRTVSLNAGSNFAAVELTLNAFSSVSADDHYTVEGFNLKNTKATALHTAQTTISVTSGHKLRTGDNIYFIDSGTNTRETAKVTNWTKTSITIDRVSTIANTSHISTCLLRIWRSTINTVTMYLALEHPVRFGTTTAETVYTDNKEDTDLGLLQSAVKPELVQYTFPKANSVIEHQDVLVVAGGDQSRQVVQWEDVNAPESTSKSTTNTPIPTYTSGDLSALASSSSGSLVCFKPTAQYAINGSLSNNAVEVNQNIENGNGVSADSALTVVSSLLVGVSPLGIWADNVGYEFGKALLSFFREIDVSSDTFLRPKRLIIYYDEIKNWVHVILPVEETTSTTESNLTDSSKHFVYMISPISDQPSCWVEFSSIIEQFPNGGFATVDDTFYFQSAYRDEDDTLKGYLHKRLDSKQLPVGLDEGQQFYANGLTYNWSWITSWDDLGEPKVDKSFEEFVLYSLQSAYTFEDFSVAFESYRDWSFSKVDTTRTLLFSKADDTKEKQFSFDKQFKCKRRAFKLSGTIAGNPPLISGYEYTTRERYAKDRMTTS